MGPAWAILMRFVQILLVLWYKLRRVMSAVPRILRHGKLPRNFYGNWWGLIQVHYPDHLYIMEKLLVIVAVSLTSFWLPQ